MIRVLLDANLLISFLLSSRPDQSVSRAVMAALGDQIHLIVPTEMIAEVRAACQQKPYLSARITAARLKQVLDTIVAVGHLPASTLPPFLPSGRDPKDDYLLVFALVERVDYLVTGDEDLLTIGNVDGVQIVNPIEFLRQMEE
ncbi:MAG: putative toxin-antitoxin system toxin component, PIN family [Caldilineaceae bacterium]|nr:putative toxin-antitoxin system toxin component, PIN family [Caldilineaceae bacterium]